MAYSSAMFQATSIMLYIHFKMEEGLFNYLSSRMISEMMNVPHPTVVKILQKLSGARLITTKEGAKGGNVLARPINFITMLDVFLAIEGEKPLFKTEQTFHIEYDDLDNIVAKGTASLKNAEMMMKKELEKVRLSDLI